MEITEIPAKSKERKITRVAAYARVSADKDAAFHSLEAQIDYYEKYVAKHPDWQLVDIYSDNGISGTIINRPEFQRMLVDCRAGKIDLVITKSVTRFARNTVILLQTIRELKDLGIDCYFEKEQMHSISPDGELLLTLLAMYAEEEARSASENQKWRIQKKFKKGEPWVGRMLGYHLEDGRLSVIPEEAEIVRWIYAEYLSGHGLTHIAKELSLRGVPTQLGRPWNISSVRHILTNEDYTGNMILQKTYRTDFRTKKTKENHGEVKMYRVWHSHEPIIEQEVFDAVQNEMKRRQSQYYKPTQNNEVGQSLFRGLIHCGLCGRIYQRRKTSVQNGKRNIWVCPSFNKLGKQVCPAQNIPEKILIEKTAETLGTEHLDWETVEASIWKIVVPEHYHLVYYLKNGKEVDVIWQHHSRRESWTPEMRQAAREKALEQHRKELK